MEFKKSKNTPFLVPHPGETLQEELEERGLTQTDFAEIIGLPIRTVNEIIKGKKSISPKIASAIGAALSTSPDLWLGMQADYDISELQKKNKKKEAQIKKKYELYSLFPISELIRRKYLPNKKDVEDLKNKVLLILGIDHIDNFTKKDFAFLRASQTGNIVENYLRTWVFLGKNKSTDLTVMPYNAEGLKVFARDIKSYSLLPVSDGIKKVVEKLNDLGVRIVFLPHFSRTRVDGAATWLSPGKPVIIMSLRFNRIDNFYFTLLHEIGHILLHQDSNKSFVDDMNNTNDNKLEKDADMFVMKMLGIENLLRQLRCRRIDLNTIKRKSDELGMHPGLLIGILQHERILNYNQYRKELTKIREAIPSNLIMG